MDPNSVFQVQCNSNFGGIAANQTRVGYNYQFQLGTANTYTQSSTATLDVLGTATTTNVYDSYKIVGLALIPNNLWTDAYPEVLVVPNNHFLRQGTLGVA